MIGTKSRLNIDNNEDKIVLIDADSLMYFSSYGSEEDQLLSETKLSEKIFDILNIIGNSYNVEKYYVFVKGKNNFRYKIYPDYKKNRPEKHPIIDILNQYLVENFGAIESHNAESDDYAFSYSQLEEYRGRCIICSVDKDMLQIPGIHYDYQKNKFHIIDEDTARYNLAIQMIMGDAADGIKGLRGYGPKKAEKIIKKGMSDYQCIKAILSEYQKNCKSSEEAKELVRLHYKLLKLQLVNVEESKAEPACSFND
jgi:DNA polymerase I